MRPLSNQALMKLLSHEVEFVPWDQHSHGIGAEPALPKFHAALERKLFELTSERGLPILDGYILGATEAAKASGLPRFQRSGTQKAGSLLGWSQRQGGMYLYPNGRLETETGRTISNQVETWLEIASLSIGRKPIKTTLIAAPRSEALELVKALGLSAVPQTNDGWSGAYAAPGLLAFLRCNSYVEFSFDTWQDLARMLERWPERATAPRPSQLTIHASTPGVPEVVGAADDTWALEGQATSKADAPRGKRLQWPPNEQTLHCDPIRGHLDLTVRHQGQPLFRERHSEGAVTTTFWPLGGCELVLQLSRRALRYLAVNQARRRPHATFERLASELDARGLPFHDAWFDFEEQFGGLVWGIDTERKLSVYEAIESEDDELELVEPPKGDANKRASDADRGADEAAPSPRSNAGTARCFGHHLILAGTEGPDDTWLVDEVGQIYWYNQIIAELALVAENGVFFLEKEAVRWQTERRFVGAAPVDVKAPRNAADSLAAAYHLARTSEASDRISEVYQSHDLVVWAYRAAGPNEEFVRIITPDHSLAVSATRLALAASPAEPAKVRVSRYQSGGPDRIKALTEAGIALSAWPGV